MDYDIKKHLIKVKGGRQYLPVAFRLLWLRHARPDWAIETQAIELDLEKGIAVFRASVYDADRRLIATGTTLELARRFPDYIEKAETGSIGRALGVAGFGTQFCEDFDEDPERPADSPLPTGAADVEPVAGGKSAATKIDRESTVCSECECPLTKGQSNLSTTKFGRPLCPAHQRATVGSG